MMNKMITLILFFCFQIGYAQSSTEGEINKKDANNMKQGHWIIYNENGKYAGYDDGQKVEEGDYLNNKKVGIWIKYYPNGNINHEITMANNIPNGYAKFYYKNGKLQEEGMWQNNKWVGEYKYYHENGAVFYKWNYNSSGKREGHQEYHHENGNMMIEGDWANGKEAGVIKEYYEDGSLKVEKNFNEGKIDPSATKTYQIGKIYHPDAKKPDQKAAATTIVKEEADNETASITAAPVVKIEAKNSNPGYLEDGYHTTYNSKGKKLKEGEFKDGKLIEGKEFQYSDGGQLEKTFTVKNGVRTEE